jgi:hypothetical protein
MSDWTSRESPIHDAAYGYLAWRESCALVTEAYRQWTAAPLNQCALAHAAYVNALDGEQRAAECYWRALTACARQAPWGR